MCWIPTPPLVTWQVGRAPGEFALQGSARASARAGKRAGSQVLLEVRASVLCDCACECAWKVCGLACAEQQRVLIPHGAKRYPPGIRGVDGRSLRRVIAHVASGWYLAPGEGSGAGGMVMWGPIDVLFFQEHLSHYGIVALWN